MVERIVTVVETVFWEEPKYLNSQIIEILDQTYVERELRGLIRDCNYRISRKWQPNTGPQFKRIVEKHDIRRWRLSYGYGTNTLDLMDIGIMNGTSKDLERFLNFFADRGQQRIGYIPQERHF